MSDPAHTKFRYLVLEWGWRKDHGWLVSTDPSTTHEDILLFEKLEDAESAARILKEKYEQAPVSWGTGVYTVARIEWPDDPKET